MAPADFQSILPAGQAVRLACWVAWEDRQHERGLAGSPLPQVSTLLATGRHSQRSRVYIGALSQPWPLSGKAWVRAS